MEYYPLRRPRFHHHDSFCLIYMDLKSPLDDIKHTEICCQALVSEIISISMYSVTLFSRVQQQHTTSPEYIKAGRSILGLIVVY